MRNRAVGAGLSWVLLASLLQAQQFSIRADYDGALQPESGAWLARSDTGFVLIEQGYSTVNDFVRICFVTVGPQGTITEVSSHGRDSLSVQPGWANGPTRLPNGEVLVAGSNYDGVRYSASAWRFSQQLDSLWSVEIYPDTSDESAAACIRERNGYYYAVGSMNHSASSVQMFLAKIDSSGNVIWTHEYGGSLREDGFSMDTTGVDGGFVLGGRTTINSDDRNAYIVKVDQLGNEQWHAYLGGPFRDGRANVVATSDHEYVSVGSFANYQSNVSTSSKLYAARLDAGGEVVWERQYGSSGPVNELSSVTELSDGSFLGAGHYSVVGGNKGVLLKFAADGDSLWMRTYRHPPLESTFSTHWLYHAIEDTDGSIVATGTCTDGQQDLWVIRVDSFGCLVPGCQLFDNIAEQGLEMNVLLYPNPTQGRLFLSFRSAVPPSGVFTLLNTAGQVVRRFQPGGSSVEIDLDISEQPAGLYLLRYSDQQGTRWESKVIKE